MQNGICTVTGIYPPEKGGPAQFSEAFSRWQIENDILPLVVTLTDKSSHAEVRNNFEVVKVSRKKHLLLRYLSTAIAIIRAHKRGFVILANGCFLEVLLSSFFPKLKYFAKVPGDIVWERARNNGLTTLSIIEFQKSKVNFRYKIFRHLFSLSLKRAALVIVPSLELKLLCVSWGVQEEKIHLIYNSVSLKDFYPKPNHEKKYQVLAVGRLVEWKGIRELIIVCHELNLQLALAGSGPDINYLMELDNRLGSRTIFLGDVSKENLRDVYNSAQFFVLNSTYEGTSHALLEARACGTFSIARSGVGSNDEVIANRVDGLLVDEQNFTLKDALEYALNNSSFVDSAQNLAVIRTKEIFDFEKNFAQIFDLVRKYSK